MKLDQEKLNHYFGNIWIQRDRSLDQYQYTGWTLMEHINSDEKVIDVGCGTNPFKGIMPNLTGIDPAFDAADYKMTLEEFAVAYKHLKFNTALCLGSINFGTVEHIERQIGLVVGLLRSQDSKIIWRCNPGLTDHGNSECEEIPFYPWTFDEHIRLAEKFGFDIIEMDWDNNNRIYAFWRQKASNETHTFQ